MQLTEILLEKNQQEQLERLQKEMLALNRMREEQQKRLNDRKQYLVQCNQEATALDRQIEELNNRLQQKRILTGAVPKNTTNIINQTTSPVAKMHTIVAAVEPLVKQRDPTVSLY